jgi:hypothetical protein
MALNLAASSLVFGASRLMRVDHRQAAVAGQLRQDGRHAGAVHLLVDLVREVLVGPVREDAATATPQRRGGHAGARAAGALLAERLLRGVLDLAAVELGTGALARVGLEGDDDLVHQRFVVVAREHGVGRVDLRGGLALFVQEFELHAQAPLAGASAPALGP